MSIGIELPPEREPVGKYVMTRQVGNLLYVAGHGTFSGTAQTHKGKLGRDLTVAEGREAARSAARNALGSVHRALGGFDRVKSVVRLFGMVNATSEFTEHPAVIDGASDVLLDTFGERGRHVRCAVGMGSLPFNMPVELELILEVD